MQDILQARGCFLDAPPLSPAPGLDSNIHANCGIEQVRPVYGGISCVKLHSTATGVLRARQTKKIKWVANVIKREEKAIP